MKVDSMTVLHVEDDASLRDLTATYLERQDDRIIVESVANADVGFDRISDSHPDCVVSDYDMPGRDGIEFLQAVREDHPVLPFILYTGKGSETVASEAISAGVTDYLQKASGPEQYELLANRIHNAVRSKEQQKELRKERRFTQQAIDALDDLFYVIGPDGTLQRWNKKGIQMTGYTESELNNKPVTELFPKDEREKVAEAIETALTEGEALLEADIRTADGQRVPYEFSGSRLTDQDGKTSGLVGIGRELTEGQDRKGRVNVSVH